MHTRKCIYIHTYVCILQHSIRFPDMSQGSKRGEDGGSGRRGGWRRRGGRQIWSVRIPAVGRRLTKPWTRDPKPETRNLFLQLIQYHTIPHTMLYPHKMNIISTKQGLTGCGPLFVQYALYVSLQFLYMQNEYYIHSASHDFLSHSYVYQNVHGKYTICSCIIWILIYIYNVDMRYMYTCNICACKICVLTTFTRTTFIHKIPCMYTFILCSLTYNVFLHARFYCKLCIHT